MSKEWYDKMYCDRCRHVIGYYIDTGPGSGVGICPHCFMDEPDTEDEEDDDE